MEEYRRVKRSNGKVTWEERVPVKKDRGGAREFRWFMAGLLIGIVCGPALFLFLGGL